MPLPHNALVLVADGRKMLFFRNHGDENQIDLRTEAHDARYERKDREIKTDAPGTTKQSFGYGRSTYEEPDFQQQEEDRWIKDAAEDLKARVLRGDFEALAIVAPPKALGVLKKCLHKEVEKRIVCTVNKEMSARPIPDIEALLNGHTRAEELPPVWAAEDGIPLPVYTIGHSTRTIPEFVDVLRAGGVRFVVDVRTVPRSRTNPQYNADVLPAELAEWQVGYDRIAELGGLRGRSPDVAPEVNGYWENRSFHNYADYALSEKFAQGLDQLERLSVERPTAIMCSEAVWWRCHRRIIADYLLLRGREVFHLMGAGRIETASRTPAAIERNGHLVYPPSSVE